MPREAFEQFRIAVLSDQSLQAELRDIGSKAEFIASVVETGARLGFRFDDADVKEALRAGHEEWLLRWM
jgi:hypothetical protein